MISTKDPDVNPANPPRVLIVDSDPGVVSELSALIKSRGCEVLEATTFEEAREIWSRERPEMLIADVRLGKFNGLQLLLRARADRPGVAAIITSPIRDVVLEADTQRFGGHFVVKPLQPQTVLDLMFGSDGSPRTLDPTGERRTGDRRQAMMPGFLPDRRLAERRRLSH